MVNDAQSCIKRICNATWLKTREFAFAFLRRIPLIYFNIADRVREQRE